MPPIIDALPPIIDEFEEYLENTLYREFEIIEAGIDISYSEDSRKKYQSALASDDAVKEFVEKENYLMEMYANMEW